MSRCENVIKQFFMVENKNKEFEKELPKVYKKVPGNILKQGVISVESFDVGKEKIYFVETSGDGVLIHSKNGVVGTEDKGFTDKGFTKYNDDIVKLMAGAKAIIG